MRDGKDKGKSGQLMSQPLLKFCDLLTSADGLSVELRGGAFETYQADLNSVRLDGNEPLVVDGEVSVTSRGCDVG